MTPQRELTAAEIEERNAISHRAMVILREWKRPILIELDMKHTIGLVGQLQLAFRHPANNGPTRQMLEEFTRELIAQIDPEQGDVYKFL